MLLVVDWYAGCIETRDGERHKREKQLREFEELIRHEESELETKLAARGQNVHVHFSVMILYELLH